MVTTHGRVRCACELHHCPAFPTPGDNLCRVCREHCAPEIVLRARRRNRRLVIAVGAAIFSVAWLIGRYVVPALSGG